jgi:glycosyltransferase involved in cell wall biosynthesis
MKILFATQVDLDQPSGAARHVAALSGALAGLGHRVTLLAPGQTRIAGVAQRRPWPALGPGARLELALAALALGEVLRDRPEVALIRLSASSSALPLALAAAGIPLVLELHGPILDQLAARGRSPAWVRAVQVNLRMAVKLARAVVVPSPALAAHVTDRLGGAAVHLVPNGVELEEVVPGDRRQARAQLGLPLEGQLVTLVATLTPELRLDLLAEAMEALPEATLVIVGDGAQRPRVERMAEGSPRVRYLGPRPHAEAVRAIQAADVCVNPHDKDLTLKGLEYAAVGRRQACFRVPGLERLEALYAGLAAVHVAPTASAPALREAIAAALEAEAREGPIAAGAIQRARAALGWARTAEALAALLSAQKR